MHRTTLRYIPIRPQTYALILIFYVRLRIQQLRFYGATAFDLIKPQILFLQRRL